MLYLRKEAQITGESFQGSGCASLSTQIEFAAMSRTVAKAQVDQALVGNAHLLRNSFEVNDRVLIQANGYLLVQLRGVGIFSGLRKVIFFSHLDDFN